MDDPQILISLFSPHSNSIVKSANHTMLSRCFIATSNTTCPKLNGSCFSSNVNCSTCPREGTQGSIHFYCKDTTGFFHCCLYQFEFLLLCFLTFLDPSLDFPSLYWYPHICFGINSASLCLFCYFFLLKKNLKNDGAF